MPLPRIKDHFANFLHTTDRWHWLSLSDHSRHHFTLTSWTKQSSNKESDHASVLGYSNLGHLHKYLIYRVDGWYVRAAKANKTLSTCSQRGYQCVRIYQRTSQVIEIEYSPIYVREVLSVSLCPDDTQPSTVFDTLVGKSVYLRGVFHFNSSTVSNFRVQKCPSDKQYTMRDCSEDAAHISFQCAAEHQLQMSHKCNVDARSAFENVQNQPNNNSQKRTSALITGTKTASRFLS